MSFIRSLSVLHHSSRRNLDRFPKQHRALFIIPKTRQFTSSHRLFRGAGTHANVQDWLIAESKILTTILLLGIGGVYFYKFREDAPVNQVRRLINCANAHKIQGDDNSAVKSYTEALNVIKAINDNDPHLCEIALKIAFIWEEQGDYKKAEEYFQLALKSAMFIKDKNEVDRFKVVILDRIAQSYCNRGMLQAAEKYYRQSIKVYSSKKRKSPSGCDYEAAGMYYNYGLLKMEMSNWKEAKVLLEKSYFLVKLSKMPDEYEEKVMVELNKLSKHISEG